MHNIEHERRPTNTPKPTSTLSNLPGLLRWVYCLKLHLFVWLCVCACPCVRVCVSEHVHECAGLYPHAGTKQGSAQLCPIGVLQVWMLSDFMESKWGGNSVIGSSGQIWSRSTQRSTLRIGNLLTELANISVSRNMLPSNSAAGVRQSIQGFVPAQQEHT